MAGPDHNHTTGSLVGTDQTVELSAIGYAGGVIQLSGTWTGTVTFEGTENGTDWLSLIALNIAESAAAAVTATVNGSYKMQCGGLSRIRARFSTASSGTVTVGIRVATGYVGPLVAGSGGGGGGGAVTAADGALVTEGATTDAAVVGDSSGTVSAKLRGLSKILNDVWDSVNHWLKVSISNATLAVTQSGTWTVQPGNTANTTAWKVDGSAVTQPVSLAAAVTANAGTNLNTSALALEAGHLASLDTKAPALGQAAAAACVPVVLPSAQVTTLTPPAAITGFALEAGHAATIDTSTAAINTATGAVADAVVAAGATGSLSAKLRAISRDLIANIVLAAGANTIGKFLIDTTDTMIGALTETAPATDVASSGLNGRLQRIAQRLTSLVSPGLSANVTVTRPSDTTAYTANDVLGPTGGGTSGIDFNLAAVSGSNILITSVTLERDVVAVISGETTYRLHLYNVTPPGALADNAAFDLPSGDRASYLGYIDIGAPVDLGSTLYIEQLTQKPVKLSGTHIFGYLVTIGAYTPASATVLKVTLNALQQ